MSELQFLGLAAKDRAARGLLLPFMGNPPFRAEQTNCKSSIVHFFFTYPQPGR